MDTKDLVVDDDGESEEVEHVRKVRPHVRGTVLAHAFRVKAVCLWRQTRSAQRVYGGDSSDLGDRPRFVISANKLNTVRVS